MMSPCVIILVYNILQVICNAQPQSSCNESDILTDLKKIHWKSIGSRSDNIPIINVSLEIVSSTLNLDITANLEYLGSSINKDGMDEFGITYVLDLSLIHI